MCPNAEFQEAIRVKHKSSEVNLPQLLNNPEGQKKYMSVEHFSFKGHNKDMLVLKIQEKKLRVLQ